MDERKIDVLDLIDVDGEKHVVMSIDIKRGRRTVTRSVPIKQFLEDNLVVTVKGEPMRLSDYLNKEIDIIVERGGLCGWLPMIGN
jgi:hypothetical protein